MEFNIDQEKLKQVLGIGEYQPKNKYTCFLPFRGEFGWYLMTFIKRVQGYNHDNKIVCIKPGHECLFPSAKNFFYNWNDISDDIKAGIIATDDEEFLKEEIKNYMQTDDIHFLSPSETSWDEKISLHNNSFIPKSNKNLGLKVDVVLTPRKRNVDPHRNWSCKNWQYVADKLVQNNVTVGVCGALNSTCDLNNVLYKSYDYVDVDSDVELMNNAKLVVTQESGLSYLSYLCKRPTFIIDHYHKNHGSDLQRDLSVPFKEVNYVWHRPPILVDEILYFLKIKKSIKTIKGIK